MAEVFVRNIPYTSSEVDVKLLLETWFGEGSVISCKLKQDPLEFQHKGYGFVTLVDHDKADILVCLSKDDEFVLQNRPLRFESSNRGSGSRVQNNGMQNRKFSFLVNIQRNLRLRQYKLEFLFKDIHEMCPAHTSRAGAGLLLEVLNPPRVYKRMSEIDIWEQQDPDLSELTDPIQILTLQNQDSLQDRWVRTIDFTPCCSIGKSLAYVVEVPKSGKSFLDKILHELSDYLQIRSSPKQLTFTSPETALPSQLLVPMLRPPKTYQLSFKLMFKLNHLVQVGSLKSPLLSDEFYQLLSQTPTEHSLWVMQELLYSDKVIEKTVTWFKEEFKRYEMEAQRFPSSPLISLDEGLIWVYRLLITPTKVYCMGPEVEISNRVTRQYINVLDNFLRVSFVEEDWETLPPAAICLANSTGLMSGFQVDRSDIHDRILEILKQGFSLVEKNYDFLAFSSSQLREQSVWMFASDYQVSAESIRLWMGDFLEIRNVAKCAARMGQCFASSTKTLAVYPNEVEHLRDIVLHTSAGEYCFSDGIGQISQSFANTVAARCGCRQTTSGRVPSAFQIRYGGYKGVVAVNPWSRYKLSLRPSMRKFESNHHYVEVIGWTKPLPCYLNRQVITLLSTLGIQDSVFEQMQSDVVSKLHQILQNRQAATEFLQAISTGASHAVTLAMLNSGYDPHSEPHLMGLLQAFRASQVARVRSKARILVPKGRCLMGCLDETATLAYGEVFVQLSSKLGSHEFMDEGLEAFMSLMEQNGKKGTCVVTGPVVVAKNPCLHPGDIRVLRAVNIPHLRHMVDCVVFPQRGHRPHPNECSGSDLDGDRYFVTWDPLLIPPITDSPMNYTPAKASLLNRRVTIEDIQEFFVQYMLNDSLGQISNAHTVLADQEEDMARNPKCLELARLFSVAVDFPKTGVAAVIPRELRPQQYPDFMGKGKRVTYESHNILGKLYRALSHEDVKRTSRMSFTKEDIAKFFDQDLILDGDSFRNYLSEAWSLKKCYDMKLLSLMDQYGITTEMEAVSGNISSPSRYFIKHQSEVKQRIRMAVGSLQEEARSWFNFGYEGPEGYQVDESIELTEWEKMSKASAWYYVSYHEDYVFRKGITKLNIKNSPLISFPWTVFDTLLAIKRMRS